MASGAAGSVSGRSTQLIPMPRDVKVRPDQCHQGDTINFPTSLDRENSLLQTIAADTGVSVPVVKKIADKLIVGSVKMSRLYGKFTLRSKLRFQLYNRFYTREGGPRPQTNETDGPYAGASDVSFFTKMKATDKFIRYGDGLPDPRLPAKPPGLSADTLDLSGCESSDRSD